MKLISIPITIAVYGSIYYGASYHISRIEKNPDLFSIGSSTQITWPDALDNFLILCTTFFGLHKWVFFFYLYDKYYVLLLHIGLNLRT